MEAFESFVALSLEAEDFVVSSAVKFDVRFRTSKASRAEFQTHGFEVDLVAARAERLVLASVKSFFGSGGVSSTDVIGNGASAAGAKRYALLNNPEVREAVVRAAAKRYGYRPAQVELRLYVGKFAAPRTGSHQAAIEQWASTQKVGSGPIRVIGVEEVVRRVRENNVRQQYRDHPVLVALKVLDAAKQLTPLDA